MNEWDLKHVDVGKGAGIDQRGEAPEHGGGVRIRVKLRYLTNISPQHGRKPQVGVAPSSIRSFKTSN